MDAVAAGGTAEVVAVPLPPTRASRAEVDLPALLRDHAPEGVVVRRSAVLGPSYPPVRALERRLAEADGRRVDRASTAPEAVAVIRPVARVRAEAGWRAVLPAFATGSSPSAPPPPASPHRRTPSGRCARTACGRWRWPAA
ncbi:hypothetical protein [Saccharothrix yanglingensis]|uniref:hypothetical protein n=1 Tax=Saccharothrix yanglingensis TaxID=659496 RepID=UPI0027D29BEC|nr:hypothetical protein [Saccharothrix yanglingensis]